MEPETNRIIWPNISQRIFAAMQKVLRFISKKLYTVEHFLVPHGKNYSHTNLRYMRQFYLLFPILRTVSEELSWTHYRYLLPIKNENERNYYINQAVLNNLSVKELIKSKACEYYFSI